MTYKYLRALMKTRAPPVDHTLKNCHVIIHGTSFFKRAYKNSGCQSILGGEYDRYADYLKNLLKQFENCNITCFVIFNGGMEADLERRTTIHQKVINNAKDIDPADPNAYCEPIFAKDVWKEVLDELGIQYYVTEHDSWKVIFSVANKFQCPIITHNYEYSLIYKDCISPKSLVYNEESREIACEIFKSDNVRSFFKLKHILLPLFFTLLDESSVYFKKLSEIVDCEKPKDILPKVLRWTRLQAHNLDETLVKIERNLTEYESQEFLYAYEKNKDLCTKTSLWPAVNHFQQKERNGNKRMPTPYINLVCNGTFSGSWVVFDKDQEDAMLAAMDIIFYACETFKFFKDAKITFIGRHYEEAEVWELNNPNNKIVTENPDLFKNFLCQTMPELDFRSLKAVPEECWILIITLAYYCRKNMDVNLAYSMILSYVMMGPVTDNVGLIRRSNFMSPEKVEDDVLDKNGLKTKDCMSVVDSIMDLFYATNLKRHFDRKVLHTFAEFQHCLQHMNYLNVLRGKEIKNTVYHRTLNVTFAYNMYNKLKNKSDPNKYIEKRLKKSTVFDFYKRIETVFEACLP